MRPPYDITAVRYLAKSLLAVKEGSKSLTDICACLNMIYGIKLECCVLVLKTENRIPNCGGALPFSVFNTHDKSPKTKNA